MGFDFTEVTLDTTVLIKAIIPPRRRKNDALYNEQLRLHTSAKAIVSKVEEGQLSMNVPAVAIIEAAAVGARLTGKEQRGMDAAAYVKANGNIIEEAALLERAVEIAAKIKISGFDSLFIACAEITGSVLVTDDKGMHEAAIKYGIRAELLRQMSI